jgi:hypothetical protein
VAALPALIFARSVRWHGHGVANLRLRLRIMDGTIGRTGGEMSEWSGMRKKGEFVTRSIAGETLVVPVRGHVGDLDAIYSLNEVGAFIWEQIDGRKGVTQVAEAVSGEFEVALEQAEKETSEFFAALEAAGMIERFGPNQAALEA